MSTDRLRKDWDVDPAEARQIQQNLREKVAIQPLEREVSLVGGTDISYDRGSDRMYGGIVILDIENLQEVARSMAETRVKFPYIPGLLAFREMPALQLAWNRLSVKPDLVITDGHGLAHPRRMGIAAHLGVLLEMPAVGCAKKVLTGEYEEPGRRKGSVSDLVDGDEKIGEVLRSRTDVNPIFVSPGHLINFEDSTRIVMRCLSRYKLPETTRAAHERVNQLRRGEIEPGYLEY